MDVCIESSGMICLLVYDAIVLTWVHVASDICRKMDAGRFDDMEMSSFLMHVSFEVVRYLLIECGIKS